MNVFDVIPGDGPVILGQPHGGTWLPDDLTRRLNENGRKLADTDWHIGTLYEGLLPDATVVRSNVHRYAIDANRDPEGATLYPGQNTTGLCPVTDFDGQPIWKEAQAPSQDEIAARRDAYHRPYHAALSEEIARLLARYGIVVLYDCHSIRSTIPFLFDGVLPVFSIGTDGGRTCAAIGEVTVGDRCDAAPGMDRVVNGRFRGGWTTRHYGDPANGVHAIQMELAQRAYLEAEAPPWRYAPDVAAPTRKVLRAALGDLDRLARDCALI